MKRLVRPLLLSACSATLLFGSLRDARAALPEEPSQLTRTTSYNEMETLLHSFEGSPSFQLTAAGQSRSGRTLYLARLRRSESPRWRLFFYAQQHGDEVSGKDALLFLVRDIVRDPERLPADFELWVMPMVNPDGAEAGTRVNAAGADLNRDHLALEQPETLALHRVVQRVRPHLAVDCHEFARDAESWTARGWAKWPDITFDALNNPLFDRGTVGEARRWIGVAQFAVERAGHRFLRYWVGGVPPDEEQRHSAPDLDSAMNAVGAYGGLSFIAEAAARRGPEAEAKELGARVHAYLALLRGVVEEAALHHDALGALDRAESRKLPAFLPTNYFWANAADRVSSFPVLELATGRTVEVATPNLMTDLVVKRSVPTPLAYAVEGGSPGASAFAALLERHAIPFERLAAPRAVEAESCTLLRVEDDFDEVYARYEGRQIVRREPPQHRELPPDSLWIPLEGEAAVRAALLLEPTSLYGLYQVPSFRALVAPGGAVPVLRVTR